MNHIVSKRLGITLFHSLLLVCMADQGASGQTLQADRIRIGTGSFGTNIVGQSIGVGNSIQSNYNFVLGQQNTVSGGGIYTATLGKWNICQASNSLIAGFYNTGKQNVYLGGTQMSSSAIFGSYNSSLGEGSLIVGYNNQILARVETIEGDIAEISPSLALIGSGLISRDNSCLIVGTNNIVSPQNNTPTAPLFIVANGTSASARSNALEVLANGDIIITKPQGDISMGAYE